MSELQDLTALIRAGTPLIVIETQEEQRIVELFRQSLMQVWRALYRWTSPMPCSRAATRIPFAPKIDSRRSMCRSKKSMTGQVVRSSS